jgi:hypothetical protein
LAIQSILLPAHFHLSFRGWSVALFMLSVSQGFLRRRLGRDRTSLAARIGRRTRRRRSRF